MDMEREELVKNIKSFEGRIGMWRIEMGKITEADFVIGYGYDKSKEKWKIYQNSERGIRSECFFDEEQEALKKLYRKVKFQYKVSN